MMTSPRLRSLYYKSVPKRVDDKIIETYAADQMH